MTRLVRAEASQVSILKAPLSPARPRPAPFNQQHNGYLKRYQSTGITRVLGYSRDLVALHRDRQAYTYASSAVLRIIAASDWVGLGAGTQPRCPRSRPSGTTGPRTVGLNSSSLRSLSCRSVFPIVLSVHQVNQGGQEAYFGVIGTPSVDPNTATVWVTAATSMVGT